MALSGKVDDKVGVVVSEDALHKSAVADIALYEGDVRELDFILDSEQVAGISQSIEDDDIDIVAVFLQEIFYEIRADEAGTADHEISLHNTL